MSTHRTLATRVAAFVLAYTVLVIVFGAWVRVTGSGAGCGQHWPTCHGEILHRPQSMETVIELTHRVTSGAAGLLSLLLCVTSFRLRPVSSAARIGAVLSVVFMITESLIGAGIVKFELVADNASVERAMGISVHLVNTSLLTGALSLSLWGARRADAGTVRPDRLSAALALAACAVTLMVMMTGAVTALGDTLFPPETGLSALDVLAQDQAAGAHLLQRARGYHPILAVAGSLLIILAMTKVSERAPRSSTRRLCRVMITLVCAQVALGVLNIWLSAPGYMQLLHLGLATVSWIALCFVTFSLFDSVPGETAGLPQPDDRGPHIVSNDRARR